MQCPVCGADIPEGQSVCPDCGTEVSAQEAVSPPPAQQLTGIPAPTPAVSPVPEQQQVAIPTPTPAAPTPMGAARLLVMRAGILTGEEFVLGGRVVIGRFDEETGPVDVDLSHLPEAGYISRNHAEIYQDASGQWFVKDLGSRNGTYIRPTGSERFQRIPANQPTPIKDGDELAFGNARFVFRIQ